MSRSFKLFLLAFIFSLPFWWTMNTLNKNLENFFYWQEISIHPEILTAQANQIFLEKQLQEQFPISNQGAGDLTIEAKAVISVFVYNNGREKILFEKSSQRKLPIASLSKLMTANVVLENYDLNKEIKISKEAVAQPENLGQLGEGKIFPVKYLFYPLLMESSNDAAYALANDYDGMNEEKFVAMMNLTAQKINLQNTFFANSGGLDPQEPKTEINYSTADDLATLAKDLLKKPLIWEVLATPKYNSYGPELNNTNELLGKDINWPLKILGGKTGYTEKANGCIILVLKAPDNTGYLINVILGSPDRFGEMTKLTEWAINSYQWQ